MYNFDFIFFFELLCAVSCGETDVWKTAQIAYEHEQWVEDDRQISETTEDNAGK